jgi:glucose/mannose-6-phosphate isomerase
MPAPRSIQLNDDLFDDTDALAAADPADMLRQVASAAAQVRESARAAAEAGIDRIAADGRPRSLVVTGMGGSGIAGDVLAAVCGTGCPVPVVAVRGYHLPGWVGPTDLVIAVSCSGGTEETLATAAEAVRRGCRLLAVGGAGSPLHDIAVQAGAPFVPVRSAGQPRSTLWGLSVPPLLAARALGLLRLPDEVLETTAQRLERVAHDCGPASESYANPAKEIALRLAGSIPMIWGSSPLMGVAAYRFACQLNENAKYPAVYGQLPEANHNQVVAFDGALAGGGADADLFRDRVEEPPAARPGEDPRHGYAGPAELDQPEPAAVRLRLVVLRDHDEHPQVARRREVSVELAAARGIPVTELAAEGDHPMERLAGLVGLVDYVTVYLALALGVDPTPVEAIGELKIRIAGNGTMGTRRAPHV